VLSNARVLTEGVDVPSLDAVIFLNSRSSTVDITQAVGRAMRKASGKQKGYIVIPVVVPDGASPQEMLGASDFKTVWEVVRALRSHDSRMEYYVSNSSAWMRNAPLRISSYGRDADAGEYEQRISQQLQLQLRQEIASKVVDTIGDKRMYPRWGERAAGICRQVQTLVKQLVTGGGAERAFERFLAGIRDSIGDHITGEQAQEMIAQHVVTIPVFDVMLAGSGFAEQNPVSQEIERLLGTFRELGVSFDEELRPLTRAYQQMEAAFEGAVTSAEKVDILREIYDGFFKAAMKNIVKRVGIVYTPVQIVDFMVRSAAAICQKEFGRSIGSENLHILDPFAGTGSYLARLIEMKDEDGNNKGYTSIAYLGLLKSSMFIYGRSYYDFDTSRIRYWRASIGKSPQTNPVSGTWSGLALGEIQQRYEPVYRKMVEGSVQVNVRLDGSDTLATVAFGNWKFLDRNERTEYPFPTSGPTFENVSVTKGGFVTDDVEMFRAAGGWVHQAISGDSTSVSGRFYGDNHGEVGGAFTLHSGLRSRACDPPFDVCDRLRGVFGAKRP